MINLDLLNEAVFDANITGTQFKTLYIIANNAAMKKSNEISIKNEWLAEKLGLTVRQIRNITDQLAEMGYLTKIVNCEIGQYSANTYILSERKSISPLNDDNDNSERKSISPLNDEGGNPMQSERKSNANEGGNLFPPKKEYNIKRKINKNDFNTNNVTIDTLQGTGVSSEDEEKNNVDTPKIENKDLKENEMNDNGMNEMNVDDTSTSGKKIPNPKYARWYDEDGLLFVNGRLYQNPKQYIDGLKKNIDLAKSQMFSKDYRTEYEDIGNWESQYEYLLVQLHNLKVFDPEEYENYRHYVMKPWWNATKQYFPKGWKKVTKKYQFN